MRQKKEELMSNDKLDNPVAASNKLKKAVLYTCITFFVIAVVFVSLTLRSKSQAGLIEVSCSAFFFVIFLHILKIIIPHSSNKIITALSVIMALMLIYVNYSLQIKEHKSYTFKELLVGDLLVKKLAGTHKELPGALLVKKLEDIMPGEFIQTKTEKDTIESSFEMPEKGLSGKPVALPLDKLSSSSVRKEMAHSFYVPKETMHYTFTLAGIEGLEKAGARIVMGNFVFLLDTFGLQISEPRILAPLYLPSEAKTVEEFLSRARYDKTEVPAAISESETQPILPEEHVVEEPGEQILERLQIH